MFDRKKWIREYQRLWMKRRREEWFQANGPCAYCGSWKNLELDHKDRSLKVDHKVWSWSKKRREAELAKCQALCERCHKRKTFLELASNAPHGTLARYNNATQCRCDLCRRAAVNYVAEYRARRRRTAKGEYKR